MLTQFIMSVMVLNCWSSTSAIPFIYFLKFAELMALNVWSFSSVAIAVLIAIIVQVNRARNSSSNNASKVDTTFLDTPLNI